VPSPGRLLKSVEGLLQETDVVGSRQVNEPGWLLTVNHLVQMTVKKRVLHVQLMDRPGTRDGDAEDDPNGGRFDDRAKSLIVVDTVTLREATNYPSGFMTSQRTVRVELVLEDPLAGDDIGTRRSRN
jgi:hypothetical protein